MLNCISDISKSTWFLAEVVVSFIAYESTFAGALPPKHCDLQVDLGGDLL